MIDHGPKPIAERTNSAIFGRSFTQHKRSNRLGEERRMRWCTFLLGQVLLYVPLLLLAPHAECGKALLVCENGCPYDRLEAAVAAAEPEDIIDATYPFYFNPPVIITVPNLTLSFSGGGNEIECADVFACIEIVAVTCTMTGSLLIRHGGILLRSGATFIQLGTLDYQSTDQMLTVQDAGTVYDQRGSLLAEFARNGVHVTNGGTWLQSGIVSLLASTVVEGTGARLSSGSKWIQTGSYTYQADTTSIGRGVALEAGEWLQLGDVTITTADDTGIKFDSPSAVWTQNSSLTITVSTYEGPWAYCLDLRNAGTWNQYGAVTLNLDSPGSNNAIICESGGVTGWTSLSPPKIQPSCCDTPAPEPTCLPRGMPSPSRTPSPSSTPSTSPTPSSTPSSTPSFSPTPSISRSPSNSPSSTPSPSPSLLPPALSRTPSPSPSPIYLVSNTTELEQVPVLQFNLTGPDIVLQPKDEKGSVQSGSSVVISLADIKERDRSGFIVKAGSITSGSWQQVEDDILGSVASYLFTSSQFDFSSSSIDRRSAATGNGTQATMQFYLFDEHTNITLGDLNFDVLPSQTKFSINISAWPWQSEDALSSSSQLEVRMKIRPVFSSFERQDNHPSEGITTFVLHSQSAEKSSDKIQMRLIDAVELDGDLVRLINSNGTQKRAVEYELDDQTSELVLRFAYFNSTLFYDPDLGVLVGSSQKSSSDDNLGLIIGAAVAIPIAVIGVILITVIVTVIIAQRRRARRAQYGVQFRAIQEEGL